MPRGSIPMRVRRRHSDAKWRASVAACYDTLKHVIPNNEKMPKRKISKALILQETERHIENIESKLKELLSQKAKSKGKSILYKSDDGFVEACLEDVRNEFSRQQHALYLRNEYRSQRKRSFPSDIEQGLIEMRSSCCDLTVIPSDDIDEYINTTDLIQQNSMDSQNCSTDETSQTSIQSPSRCSEGDDKVIVQLAENSLYPANSRLLDKIYSTEMTPKMEALLKTPDKSIRPKRPYKRRNRYVTNQVKTAGLKQDLHNLSANKYNTHGFEERLYKDKVDGAKRHSPEKSFKQLLLDTNSGFTPLKLPENHLISPALTHPSFSEMLENSPLTALNSDLINQCNGLPDNNGEMQSTEDFDDPSNLFCTESIDQMDLDDSIDREQQTTPNYRTSKKNQIKREIDHQHSRKFRTRIHGYSDYEHDSHLDSGPVYTIKREARKCCRQLEKSFPTVETKSKEDVPVITGVFENTDNSCPDFDGYFLFYQQMAEEKPSDSVTERASEVSQMWQNLSTDTRDTFVAMAAHEISHSSSSDLSEDLIELDVKPLKGDSEQFRTSTPTPLQPPCSQVVPISENTDFKQLGLKLETRVQANIDLQLVPNQPLCDFNGATPILLVKPDIIQLDENYIADEVIVTSQDYEVPSMPDEVPEEKALDLSMERHSSTSNRLTNDSDLQSVSWNTQVVPQMDFATFSQHDLF